MKRPSLKRQLTILFLCVIIPVSLLLSLLLVYAAEYSRSRLAHTTAGNLQLFGSTLERQMLAAESYLLNLSLNDAKLRNLSEETSRTQAYLDLCELVQGFPALLAANDALMGIVLVNGANNMYKGAYGTVYGGQCAAAGAEACDGGLFDPRGQFSLDPYGGLVYGTDRRPALPDAQRDGSKSSPDGCH